MFILVVERRSDRVCRAAYEAGWGAGNADARVLNARILPTRRVLPCKPLRVMRDPNISIARPQKSGRLWNCCTPQNILYCSSSKAAWLTCRGGLLAPPSLLRDGEQYQALCFQSGNKGHLGEPFPSPTDVAKAVRLSFTISAGEFTLLEVLASPRQTGKVPMEHHDTTRAHPCSPSPHSCTSKCYA